MRQSKSVNMGALALSGVVLLVACAGGGEEPDADQSEIRQGDPSHCVDDEIVDILRTLDHPDCRREGAGCPIGECPPGCVGTAPPSVAVDVQRQCRLTAEDLGGPAVCRTELEAEDCGHLAVCRVDPAERAAVFGGKWCWGGWPEDWDQCEWHIGSPPLCADLEG